MIKVLKPVCGGHPDALEAERPATASGTDRWSGGVAHRLFAGRCPFGSHRGGVCEHPVCPVCGPVNGLLGCHHLRSVARDVVRVATW